MTNTTHLSRRQGGAEPDILGLRVAHRSMRGDLHRLTALMQDVAARTPRSGSQGRHARAL